MKKKILIFLTLILVFFAIGCSKDKITVSDEQPNEKSVQFSEESLIEKTIRDYSQSFIDEDVDLCSRLVNWNELHALDVREAARIQCLEWMSSGQKFQVASIESIIVSGDTSKASIKYKYLTTEEELNEEVSLIKINGEWKIDIKIPE